MEALQALRAEYNAKMKQFKIPGDCAECTLKSISGRYSICS